MAQTKTPPTTEELQAQIATLRGDVETLTKLLRETAEHRVSETRARMSAKAGEARTAAEKQVQHMADSFAQYQSEAEAAVRSNPAAALGIAGGVGFLIGLVLARK